MTNNIKIHNDKDFENMRLAGQLNIECLDFITDFILTRNFNIESR